jgi:urease accessory protein
VRSRIDVVAELRAGRTVVTSCRESADRGAGHFAGRLTGAGVVHLVGTAAGPLGGDEAVISVRVGAGARLTLRSAGATIVQPSTWAPDSRLRLELRVDDGGRLDVAMEPTVVCAAAVHQARTVVELAGSGQVRLLEQVLLGRSGEPGGEWSGRLVVDRDGQPVLRHTLRSGLLGRRVVSTLLDTGVDGEPATSGSAVAMPLAAGGLLVTATGADLIPTHRDLLAAALPTLLEPQPSP